MVQLQLIRVSVELPCHDALDNRNLQEALVHDHVTMTSNHQDHHITMKKLADLLAHDHNHDVDDGIGGGKGGKEDDVVLNSRAVRTHFQAVALIRRIDTTDEAR